MGTLFLRPAQAWRFSHARDTGDAGVRHRSATGRWLAGQCVKEADPDATGSFGASIALSADGARMPRTGARRAAGGGIPCPSDQGRRCGLWRGRPATLSKGRTRLARGRAAPSKSPHRPPGILAPSAARWPRWPRWPRWQRRLAGSAQGLPQHLARHSNADARRCHKPQRASAGQRAKTAATCGAETLTKRRHASAPFRC